MAWYTVDTRLLTIKVFYFLTLSALATLLPYFPIILSQLGVQAQEIALIYFLIFFSTFIKNILVGFIADKYQLHKVILVLSCILTGPLYALILVVPPLPATSSILSSTQLQLDCVKSPAANTTISDFVMMSSKLTNVTHCQHRCGGANASIICTFDQTTICEMECKPLIINSISKDESQSLPSTKLGEDNPSQISYSPTNNSISDNSLPYTHCKAMSDCVYQAEVPPYRSFTFWACLTIGISAALCGSNELMMNDAIAISLLGDDRRKWGKSRLWGSLGYGLSAILVSLLIDRLGVANKSPTDTIDYAPAFYIYLALSLSSGVVAFFHPTGEMVKSSQLLKGMQEILRDIRVWVFLSMILLLGYYNGVMMTFAYLYLRTELKASQLCLGLCVLTTVIVEVPILFIGGKIVDKIGAISCLYLAIIAYGLRFLAYIYIPDPWYALLIELGHMFTFGLMFTAANMHGGAITAAGNTGTMIGLINGIKWGLGLGLGSLIGGQMAAATRNTTDDKSGFKSVFLINSISCAVALVFYVLVYEVIIRRCCPPKAADETHSLKDEAHQASKSVRDGGTSDRVDDEAGTELLDIKENGEEKVISRNGRSKLSRAESDENENQDLVSHEDDVVT